MPAAGMIAFIESPYRNMIRRHLRPHSRAHSEAESIQSFTVCFGREAFQSEESERAQRSIVELHSERGQLLHSRKVLRPLHERAGPCIDDRDAVGAPELLDSRPN